MRDNGQNLMLRYKLSTVKRRSGTAQSTAVGGHMLDISNCSTVNGSCGSHYNGRDVEAQRTVVGRHPLSAIMADIHGYTHLALGPKNGCYTRLELTTAARCSRYYWTPQDHKGTASAISISCAEHCVLSTEQQFSAKQLRS